MTAREFSRKRFRPSVVAALLIVLALPAAAHDFWIEPTSFRPVTGSKVPLRLYVGQNFSGASTIYLPDTFERYVYAGPDGEKKVPGIAGDDPAGTIAITRLGLYVVGYRSTLFSVTFDNLPEFEKYLEKEGLERVRSLQAYGAGTKNKIIRENYSRSAKALVMAGRPDNSTQPDRALGLRLELVAEKNPYLAARVPVRLLYEGQPLEGALVVAFNKAEPLKKLKARTDKDGRVQMEFMRPGTWLVTSVHMFPASAKSGADWESVWASLTFERPRTGK